MKTKKLITLIALLGLLISVSACNPFAPEEEEQSDLESVDRWNAGMYVSTVYNTVTERITGFASGQGQLQGAVVHGLSGTAAVTGHYEYRSGVSCGSSCVKSETDADLIIVFDNYTVMSSDNMKTTISGTVSYQNTTWSRQSGYSYSSGGRIQLGGSGVRVKSINTDPHADWGYQDTITFSASSSHGMSWSGTCAGSNGASHSI